MDSASVTGIIGSVVGVADVVTKTINHLSKLRTRYGNANLSIPTLHGQLCMIKTPLEQLKSHDVNASKRWQTFVKHLYPVLEGCQALIADFDERLER